MSHSHREKEGPDGSFFCGFFQALLEWKSRLHEEQGNTYRCQVYGKKCGKIWQVFVTSNLLQLHLALHLLILHPIDLDCTHSNYHLILLLTFPYPTLFRTFHRCGSKRKQVNTAMSYGTVQDACLRYPTFAAPLQCSVCGVLTYAQRHIVFDTSHS